MKASTNNGRGASDTTYTSKVIVKTVTEKYTDGKLSASDEWLISRRGKQVEVIER